MTSSTFFFQKAILVVVCKKKRIPISFTTPCVLLCNNCSSQHVSTQGKEMLLKNQPDYCFSDFDFLDQEINTKSLLYQHIITKILVIFTN